MLTKEHQPKIRNEIFLKSSNKIRIAQMVILESLYFKITTEENAQSLKMLKRNFNKPTSSLLLKLNFVHLN